MRFLLPLALLATPALADLPVVKGAVARNTSSGWSFDVAVRHADTGWDHYADGWSLTLADGTVLGHRQLLHPHVEEQPFTRSLGGIVIPDGVERVMIRAHDNVHGWGPELEVDLP